MFFDKVAAPLEQALASLVRKIVGGFKLDINLNSFSSAIGDIAIPDASQVLPNLPDLLIPDASDFAKCTWQEITWSITKYDNVRQELLGVTPLAITGPNIEQTLKDALPSVTAPDSNYESACEAAWNNLKEGNDMGHCKKVVNEAIDALADAMVDGDCLAKGVPCCIACNECCNGSSWGFCK